MNIISIATIGAVLVLSSPLRADPSLPDQEKEAIESLITNYQAVAHPEYSKLHFSFFLPQDVVYGTPARLHRAVQCEWFADDSRGSPFLMVVREVFLIDLRIIIPVDPRQRFEWVGGNPTQESKRSFRSADVTRSFETPGDALTVPSH